MQSQLLSAINTPQKLDDKVLKAIAILKADCELRASKDSEYKDKLLAQARANYEVLKGE